MKKIVTETKNFQELFGNGIIFKIPPFQRNYSWDKDNYEELWEDLTSIDNVHFMGFIVLKNNKNHDNEYIILDGQQRITTLSIFILAAMGFYKEITEKTESADIKNQHLDIIKKLTEYVAVVDIVKNRNIRKLTLNPLNNSVYSVNIFNATQPQKIPQLAESNRLLIQCYEFFYNQFMNNYANNPSELYYFITQTISSKLLFSVITVNDDIDGYNIFMTLNARGMRLSTIDLIKNHIFSNLANENEDINHILRLWEDSIRNVEQDNFDDFFRYFWHSFNKYCSERELFKEFLKNKNQNDYELLEKIYLASQKYAFIVNNQSEVWLPEQKNYLEVFQLIKLKIHRPVLLALVNYREKKFFNGFLHNLAKLVFRYNLVCHNPTKEEERLFVKMANAITDGNISKAFEMMEEIYPSKEVFTANFAKLQFPKDKDNKKIKYILNSIENDNDILRWESHEISVEHIIPKNWQKNWSNVINDKNITLLYNIGNMALLNTEDNSKINDESFAVKKTYYEQSLFSQTQILSKYEFISANDIEYRAQKLAKIAEEKWRIDFKNPPNFDDWN